MGISARRAALRSFWISEIGPSRSQDRGDSGSVNPRVMSTTTRAGRRSKPPRPPNPSMCAKALIPVAPRFAEFAREPLVELAAGLGDHAPLFIEGRQVSVVEPWRLATASHYLLALRFRRYRVYGSVVTYHDAVETLGGLGAYEAPADVFGCCLGVALQGVSDAPGPGRLEDEAVALRQRELALPGRALAPPPRRPRARLPG